MGEIFANYVSAKRLISRIYKEFLQLRKTNKQPLTTIQFKNWQRT